MGQTSVPQLRTKGMNKDELLPKKKCLQFEFDQVNFPLKNATNNLQRSIESHDVTFYNVQDTI